MVITTDVYEVVHPLLAYIHHHHYHQTSSTQGLSMWGEAYRPAVTEDTLHENIWLLLSILMQLFAGCSDATKHPACAKKILNISSLFSEIVFYIYELVIDVCN